MNTFGSKNTHNHESSELQIHHMSLVHVNLVVHRTHRT